MVDILPEAWLLQHAEFAERQAARDPREMSGSYYAVNIASVFREVLANRAEIARLRAEVETAQQCPAGWVMMPVDLSDEMLDAMWETSRKTFECDADRYLAMWAAMLAAAPSPKGGEK